MRRWPSLLVSGPRPRKTLHQSNQRQLIRLLNSLEGNPELHLAVGLVAFYGLRPAELMVLSFEDGKLKVGNAKRNSRTAATPKKAFALSSCSST